MTPTARTKKEAQALLIIEKNIRNNGGTPIMRLVKALATRECGCWEACSACDHRTKMLEQFLDELAI